MRLIDADTLKENIPKTNGKIFSTVLIDCDEVRKMIDEQPTIEPKHGRWIPQPGDRCCCSECGAYALDCADGKFVHLSVETKFCYNCGAQMERRNT